MTFGQEVTAEHRGQGPRCVIGAILSGADLHAERPLDGTDLAELRAMCDQPEGVNGHAVTRALKKRGYRVGADAFNRHSTLKVCSCWR